MFRRAGDSFVERSLTLGGEIMWGIVSAIMSTIMEWVDKIKERLKPHNEAHIQISPRSQNVPNQRSPDAPRIVIKQIHHYPSAYSSDVTVEHPNLGHGIHVNRMRKPVRCPLCASRSGRIVENRAGAAHRWKCEDCQSTFN